MDLQFVPIRHDKKHENRHLLVLDLAEVSRALGATVVVSRLNVMSHGAAGGNYWQRHEFEALRVVVGRIRLDLCEARIGALAEVFLDAIEESPDCRCLIVPPEIGYAVSNVGEGIAILEVFATEPSRLADEDFPCEVVRAPWVPSE